MNLIPRTLKDEILQKILHSNKVLVLYGPRQTGKTTLIKELINGLPLKKLEINADQTRYQDTLASRDLLKMQELIGDAQLLFIDEAQRIPDIGINLKIMHDEMPELKIIATGSSSFELANRTKEPLTGRTWTYTLYPIAQQELAQTLSKFELRQRLEQYLVFGSYPGVLAINSLKDKIHYLSELSSSYLYKDILDITAIKHSEKLSKLLRLLALQVGSEVSYNELGNALQMSKDTIGVYIDLLEKAFVLFRLTGYSRNLRKEITKMDKIFFVDNGIRNALIDNFNPIDKRSDAGQLWENFLISERRKRNAYSGAPLKSYFWRTYTGAELDYVEEGMGALSGYEFKVSPKNSRITKSWQEVYPEASASVVHSDNYLDFVL